MEANGFNRTKHCAGAANGDPGNTANAMPTAKNGWSERAGSNRRSAVSSRETGYYSDGANRKLARLRYFSKAKEGRE
jgi:hypothetical protein